MVCKSKSKDGKKGWVNVVTGDSCASINLVKVSPSVSSAKRASMSKKERKAAQAAKRREDPDNSRSLAAAPTMVKTDRKTRKEEMEVNELKDNPVRVQARKMPATTRLSPAILYAICLCFWCSCKVPKERC